MNTAPSPRYSVDHMGAVHYVMDDDEPDPKVALVAVLGDSFRSDHMVSELLASLLNRAEAREREIEWLREQHERLEQMIISLQDVAHGHAYRSADEA